MNRIEKLARAINGPWEAGFFERDYLEKLREIRWGFLTEQEQATKLAEAQAVIVELDYLDMLGVQ